METLILNPDPIEIIERTLRDVIHDVLSNKFGPDWVQDTQVGLDSEWVNNLQKKAKAHQGIQKPVPVYDIPLAYAEFSDLGKLLTKHKTLFEPIFGDWQTFWTYYEIAEKLRNEIKHHRDLSPTQPSLLLGIAGEVEDLTNLWRIGTRLQTKRTLFQFSELISVQGKTEDEILNESENCITSLQEVVLSAIDTAGLQRSNIDVEKERFALKLRGQQIKMEISTAPTASSSLEINGIAGFALKQPFDLKLLS